MIRKEFLYLGWYLLLCIPVIIVYIKYSVRAKKEWLTLVGQIKPEIILEEQEREYIRLDSAFPVEFQKVEEGQTQREFDIHQGFTRNISKKGICVEALTVRGKKLEDLIPNKTKLKLIINIPSEATATIALTTVMWVHKTEDVTVDRYTIGVSYDEIADPDLSKIVRYALWFRRKPDILGLAVVAVLMLIAALVSTVIIFKDARSNLEKRIRIVEGERLKLAKEAESIKKEKKEVEKDLNTISQEYAMLLKGAKGEEAKREYKKIKEPPVIKETIEEVAPETEEREPEEEAEVVKESLEPAVELRRPVAAEDEIVVEPNITRKMIETEKEVYKTFRDYILREEMQLLDRYSSQHRTSIYHPASLFALAELRYKNRHIKEMTMKAYRDVIRLYPRSKYASYASHRLEQISRNLPYGAFSLKYYCAEYNLPPLFDYRELEPYKE